MKRYHFAEISSTNDYARELLLNENGVVVTADYQTMGKGRSDKSWEGDFGENVYFSWAKNHAEPVEFNDAVVYQGLAAIAVKITLQTFARSVDFKLKYPNDVYAKSAAGYRKISGILVEHGFFGDKCKSTVIGIGINVNQTEFSAELNNNVVSLKNLGYKLDIDDIYNELLENINLLDQKPKHEVFENWIKELNITGKALQIINKKGNWTAGKVMVDGRILAVNSDTNETIYINDGDSVRYEF